MVYSTDGLVLREIALGEHDKLLTILTPTDGRITVSAKGARSSRSKIGSATKLFTYANFEIYKKGESRYIKDASITEPFFGLSDDIEKMALASYICEVSCDITGEGVSSVDIMRMTLNSFYAISKGLYPLPIIKAVYEIRAAGFSGYVPNLDGCAVCSDKITKNGMLDVMNGCI
jgi:DNA repair protein RecO (recombination protein O)